AGPSPLTDAAVASFRPTCSHTDGTRADRRSRARGDPRVRSSSPRTEIRGTRARRRLRSRHHSTMGIEARSRGVCRTAARLDQEADRPAAVRPQRAARTVFGGRAASISRSRPTRTARSALAAREAIWPARVTGERQESAIALGILLAEGPHLPELAAGDDAGMDT